MRVTEQQLYNMICESIHCTLNEAGEQQSPDVVGTFDENGAKNRMRRLSDRINKKMSPTVVNKKIKAGPTGARSKSVGLGVGTKVAYNSIANMGNALISKGVAAGLGSTSFGELAYNAGGLAIAAGGFILNAAIITAIAMRWKRFNQFDKGEVPTNLGQALKIARIVSVERLETLKLFNVAQETLCNATHAWNQIFPDNPKNWREIAQYLGNGTNRYLGESKLFESNQNQIPSVAHFINLFRQLQNSGKEKEIENEYNNALEKVKEVSNLMEYWNNYLHKIADTHKNKGITFKKLVDINQLSQLLMRLSKKSKLGNIANQTLSLNREETANASVNLDVYLRVVYATQSYVVFRQDKTNHYFYLNVQKGHTYKVGNGYILKGYVYKNDIVKGKMESITLGGNRNNFKINAYVLNPTSVVKKLVSINDN